MGRGEWRGYSGCKKMCDDTCDQDSVDDKLPVSSRENGLRYWCMVEVKDRCMIRLQDIACTAVVLLPGNVT